MWLDREIALIGTENTNKLKNSHVAVFGIGGVGGFACEALVRSGIGTLTFIDCDCIDETNINRQIIADTKSIGKMKADVMAERAKIINPNVQINNINIFADKSNTEVLLNDIKADFILDCIDTVTTKLIIAKWAYENNVPIISSMGTANKLDPSKFQITDIYKTSVCPLARVMRSELRKLGVKKLPVIFSTEEPVKLGNRVPASISFVPSAAGLIMAGYAVRKIIEK